MSVYKDLLVSNDLDLVMRKYTPIFDDLSKMVDAESFKTEVQQLFEIIPQVKEEFPKMSDEAIKDQISRFWSEYRFSMLKNQPEFDKKQHSIYVLNRFSQYRSYFSKLI